jgi:hypothetical protein
MSARCVSLGEALWTGAYRRPEHAGFGPKAFANDLVSLSMSLARDLSRRRPPSS